MRAEERKTHILNSAKKVFGRYGYHRTNIAMICSQAGIGRGTLYQYFKNKKGVFEAIMEDIAHKATQVFADELQPIRTWDDLKRMQTERFERILMLIQEDRDFARVAFSVSGEFPKMKQEIDRHFISLLKKEIQHSKSAGIFHADIDTEVAAVKLYGGTEKIINHFFLSGTGISKKKWRTIMEQVIRLDMFGYHHFDDISDENR